MGYNALGADAHTCLLGFIKPLRKQVEKKVRVRAGTNDPSK